MSESELQSVSVRVLTFALNFIVHLITIDMAVTSKAFRVAKGSYFKFQAFL